MPSAVCVEVSRHVTSAALANSTLNQPTLFLVLTLSIFCPMLCCTADAAVSLIRDAFMVANHAAIAIPRMNSEDIAQEGQRMGLQYDAIEDAVVYTENGRAIVQCA